MKNKINIYVLIFPIIYFISSIFLLNQLSPIGLYNPDPSYQYLYSGLQLLSFHAPQHIDHPGTPLQMLSAFIILCQWALGNWFSSSNEHSVFIAVATSPEKYLYSFSIILNFLISVSLYYFGKKIRQLTSSLSLGALGQISLFTLPNVLLVSFYPRPESLLIFVCFLLMTQLIGILFDLQSEPNTSRSRFYICVLCGLGLAIKLTFLPLLGLIFIFDKRVWIKSVCITALSFFVFTSPLIPAYKRLIDWLVSLVVFSGIHGSGKANFIDFGSATSAFLVLIHTYTYYYIFLTIVAVILSLNLIRRASLNKVFDFLPKISLLQTKYLLVIFCVGITGTFMVMKHPGVIYLLPLIPLSIAGLIWLSELLLTASKTLQVSKRLIAIALIAYSCFTFVNNVREVGNSLQSNKECAAALRADILTELHKYPDRVVFGAAGCTLTECAISFALDSAPSIRGLIASLIGSNFYLFNDYNGRLMSHQTGWISKRLADEILHKHSDVFLVSPEEADHFPMFDLIFVTGDKGQKLYRVTGISQYYQ